MPYNFELMANYVGQERYGHASVVFDKRMWIIQGYSGSAALSNIGVSKDGVNWNWLAGSIIAPNPARYGHKVVEFNGELYMTGGLAGAVYCNDCWKSGNGTQWERITNSVWGNLLGRAFHEMMVLDGRMWLIGGNNASQDWHDIWSSVDGVTWSRVGPSTFNPPWIDRSGHACCVYDNRCWLTAGYCAETSAYQQDCWYTQNFVDWTRAELPVDFTARNLHTMTVYDAKMVVIGGSTSAGRVGATDLYYSAVGTQWKRGIQTLPFTRLGHTALEFDGRLWVIGGASGGTTATATVYRSNSMEWQDTKI